MSPSTAAEAAGPMRQERRHHQVVAEGQRLVGVLSALDLPELVEERDL